MAVGVSLFPGDTDTRRQLLDRARLAARASLASNALDFRFYSRETDEWAMRRHRLAQRLGEAVRADAVRPVYQPFYCMRRGVVTGCEALARWRNPELGPISPTEFIPLAEDEPALIHALTVAVLSRSCRQALAWDHAGAPPLRVAINFSGQTLYREDFPNLVLRVLAKEGFPSSRVTVELTEQSIISNVDTARNMEALRRHGVRFAVDDFGTGYSSLSYLRRLPIDVVKIDRSFMEDIATETVAWDLTRGILDIARTLKLKAVAEGVEHAQQLEALRELDCDLAQGFLLAKPMAGDEVLSLLTHHKHRGRATRKAQPD